MNIENLFKIFSKLDFWYNNTYFDDNDVEILTKEINSILVFICLQFFIRAVNLLFIASFFATFLRSGLDVLKRSDTNLL